MSLNLFSDSDSDSDSGEKTSESNNDSSSSSDFAPAKKKKKRDTSRSERDMVMKVIQNNPDDFGVRRSARPVKKYSEGDSDDASKRRFDASSEPARSPRKR